MAASSRTPNLSGPLRQHAELIERAMELGGVAIDTEGAGAGELVVAVASAQQADAQHARASRREEIPHGIADHVTVFDLHAEAPLAGEEQIGLRLRSRDVATLDDDGFLRHAEGVEGGVDLRTTAGRRDAVRHRSRVEESEQLDGAGQRAAFREEAAKQLTVPTLDDLGLVRRDLAADPACDAAREQAAAHADTTVDAPAVDGETGFGESALPGEDVRVDGVDQRPVEIENQRLHADGAQRQRGPGCPSHDTRGPSTLKPAATNASNASLSRIGRPSHCSTSRRRTRR